MKKFILYIFTGLLLSAIIMIPFAGGIFSLGNFITGTDMLTVVCLWALGFAVTAFIFGIITNDYSWIDRIWSILPVGFVWYYAYRGGFSLALCAAAALVTVWGARLTFNFARKGGYSGMEDYRWIHLRKKITNPVLWQLFNFFFISFFQTGLFVLFTFPVYSMTFHSDGSLPVLFWIFAGIAAVLVCLEFAADQQQWNFHAAKKAEAEQKIYPSEYRSDVKSGFLSHGLFGLCRHPNYFCELGFWWTMWLAAFSLNRSPLGSGLFGPVMLTFIFIGSTIMTESISASKYPDYREYQKKVVSPIIPWFTKK